MPETLAFVSIAANRMTTANTEDTSEKEVRTSYVHGGVVDKSERSGERVENFPMLPVDGVSETSS